MPSSNPNVPRITSAAEIVEGFELQLFSKWDLILNRFLTPVNTFQHNLLAIQANTVTNFVNQLSGNTLDDCFTAIGASDKAKRYLPNNQGAIRTYITNALTIAGVRTVDAAIEHLCTGYALISGDSLGGASRNLVGTRGEDLIQQILTNSFAATVVERNSAGRPKITQFIQNNSTFYVHWNKRIPMAAKNYDFIITNSRKFNENDIIAVLEIKSGCDPAGADEHWNTAKGKLSTLNAVNNTIRCGFASIIIDNTVRNQIANEINSGLLVCGINLNDDSEIVRGIVTLT